MDEWWRTFFDDRYRRFWAEYTSQERTDADVAGILRLLERYGVCERSRVLDLACGDARIAVGLARAGHRVTGLDYSASQLDAARERVAAAGVDVHLVEADMRRPPPELGPFDAIVNWFTSFGYFEEPATTCGCWRSIRDMICRAACWCSRPSTRPGRPLGDPARARLGGGELAPCCSSSASSTPWPVAAASACASSAPDGEAEERTFHTRLYTATELVLAGAGGGPRGRGRATAAPTRSRCRPTPAADRRPTRGRSVTDVVRGEAALLDIPASPGKFLIDAGPVPRRAGTAS